MKKERPSSFDLEKMQRYKRGKPELKFEWLQAALEFTQTPKRIVKK